jgi:hypothetical protein
MFDLPWYKIGLYGRKFAEEYDREQEAIYRDEKRDGFAFNRFQAYIPIRQACSRHVTPKDIQLSLT